MKADAKMSKNKNKNKSKFPTNQRGVAMIESLVSMLVISFGLLGFVGLQAKTTMSQVEAQQRAQAIVLLADMSQRISINRNHATDYEAVDIGVITPADACPTISVAEQDVCEWAKLILGAAEQKGTGATALKVGAMLGARGCISSPTPNTYLISIAWQGIQATGAPTSTCGQDAYSHENKRRVVTTVLQIATLSS